MKKKILIIALWAASPWGCIDADLLDEVATSKPASTSEDGGPGGAPSGETDSGELPEKPASDPADGAPPAIIPLACGKGEESAGGLCIAASPVGASVRFETDEPASISALRPENARILSPPFATVHHAVIFGLAGDTAFEEVLEAVDASSNAGRIPVSGRSAKGPAVAVTEVYADPLGAEPAQEFVEIANIGVEPVDVSGWMIDDGGDANGDVLPPGAPLAPGEVALIVGPGYDPASPDDTPPAAGARVISLASSIGTNGLRNSDAETVELYGGTMALVSTYGGSAGKPREGVSACRLDPRLPDGDPLAFAACAAPTPGAI